ncbi:hypothetical protein ACFX12_027206 [Malus domestica]
MGILRDYESKLRCLMANAESVRVALLVCIDMGFDAVQIESDSKRSVDMINGKAQPNVAIDALLLDIQYGKQRLSLYKYYHNTIIVESKAVNPSRKLTFTEARKSLVGDIGSVQKVFKFLEVWEDNSKAAGASSNGGGAKESPKKRTCNGCKSICSIASTTEN